MNLFEMEKYSDFAKVHVLAGDKIKIDEVLNREIVIIDFRIDSTKYKSEGKDKYVRIQFRYKNDEEKCEKVLFTGSQVIINQLVEFENKIPFLTTIKKINKYYSFT